MIHLPSRCVSTAGSRSLVDTQQVVLRPMEQPVVTGRPTNSSQRWQDQASVPPMQVGDAVLAHDLVTPAGPGLT